MQYLLFLIKGSLEDFRRNKGRTILTSLGILIGVSSVVLLMSFGLGLKKYIENQFESLGTNLVRIVPGRILSGGGFRSGPGAFGGIRFDEKDVASLKRIKEAEYIIPVFTKTITASSGKNSNIADLYASSADIFLGINLKTKYGAAFTKDDVEKRSKVAVVGPKIAAKLYDQEVKALDKIIKVQDQSFRIIGVLEAKGGGFGGPDLDSFVYLPYKTAFSLNPDKKFMVIIAKARTKVDLEVFRNDIKKQLLKRYKEDDFSVIQQAELLSAISSIFSIINTVLVAIAAISLLVGGIGIMNIMYVTVTERIKEIGIRRAIGATRKDILFQFLAEAVFLSLIGGLLGLTVSFLIVLLVQRVFPAYINLQTVAIALGVSSLIGIIFGVFPAKKAADLSPIEAIRYE
ncbi:ABC transporter permease [Candidatus Gottesmanbacteria bacterium]|nr:ABC transporter permease [Candidatus Gottesmanbacteria bacterium]